MLDAKESLGKAFKFVQLTFEELLDQITQEESLEKRLVLAKKAIEIANRGITGYYSSEIIENVYLELAQKHSVPLPDTFEPDSFLHVMTESYEVGGHTRVVERWIELSELCQKHSVIFTTPNNEHDPLRLKKVVAEKNGTLTCIPDELSALKKALFLRQEASKYSAVILHVHMEDTLPLLAFGTEEFQRPIFFFNHADHRFWLGVSIADKVIDLRSWGQNISLHQRGVRESSILGIPMDGKIFKSKYNKDALRKKLGLDPQQKILITVGAYHKYTPLLQFDFIKTAQSILDHMQEACIIAIGPSYTTFSTWKKLHKKFPTRFLALGRKKPELLHEYLACADICLDSYPMSGCTALMDALSVGCPILSLACPTGQLDYVVESDAYCATEEIFMDKIKLLLGSAEARRTNIADVLAKLMQENSTEVWRKKLAELYKSTQKHSLHKFSTMKNDELTLLDMYLCHEAFRIKRRISIPGLIEWSTMKIHEQKKHKIVLFGKYKIIDTWVK